jgi:hypothetical protein
MTWRWGWREEGASCELAVTMRELAVRPREPAATNASGPVCDQAAMAARDPARKRAAISARGAA